MAAEDREEQLKATLVARRRRGASRVGVVISVVLLVALVAFVAREVGDAERFIALARQAHPTWLLAAIALQVGTYVATGAIWGIVTTTAGHPQKLLALTRLAVEKLTMDHLVPTGGLAGDLVIVGAMRRLGVSATVAMEALLIDILGYYGAYGAAATAAVVLMQAREHVPQSVVTLMVMFVIGLVSFLAVMLWFLSHRDRTPPQWLLKFEMVRSLTEVVEEISVKRVRNPSLLLASGALHLAVFALDGATLWACLQALGVSVDYLVCFAALTIASMSATVSLLPGGIGTFEAGAVGTLVLFGVSPEAALMGTLLFRGLALWLPLLPGFLLTRRDLTGWLGGQG